MTDELPNVNIIVAIPNAGALREFIDSGFQDNFTQAFNLAFLTPFGIHENLKITNAVFEFGLPQKWRVKLYNTCKGLWHFSHKKKYVVNQEYAFHRSFFGVSEKQKYFIRFIADIGLAKIIALILRFFLRSSVPVTSLKGSNIDGIFLMTSIESYFADDVVRISRKQKIPLLAFQINWDGLATKTFLEQPSNLAVWGEQSFLIARLMHNIPPHRIYVTGTPRLEGYNTFLDKKEARKKLKLPLDAKILYFCGSSVPFDEVTPINKIIQAISDGILPSNTIVLYRPHPQRHARTGESNFLECPPYSYLLKRSSEFSSIIQEDNYYFSAVDAVITPFSTMGLEASFFGLPLLCLGYNDSNHSNFDWVRQSHELHLYYMRHDDWCTICDDPKTLIDSLKTLMENLLSEEKISQAKSAFKFTCRVGDQKSLLRISDAMQRVIAGKDSDQSFELSQSKSLQRTALLPIRDKDL